MFYAYQYNYFYDSTALIVGFFEKNGIPFDIDTGGKYEEIHSPVRLGDGKEFDVRFICPYDDFDVPVKVTVIDKVPEDKKTKALDICNKVTRMNDYLRCQLTLNDSIEIGYGISPATSQECLGAVAGDILIRIRSLLNECYRGVVAALRE